MKVVAICGSARKKGNTYQLMSLVLEELQNEGIEVELIELAGEKISGCRACFGCLKNKDGRCVVDDDIVNTLLEKMQAADGILLGSPTYFADVSTELKAVIDRCGMTSRVNGDMLKRKVGSGVIAVRRAGAIHALDSINHFFLIGGMVVVGSSYWNIGIGREKGEVMDDAEGVKTMKDLGQNMAWAINKLTA